VEALAGQAGDPDPRIRFAAVKALVRISTPAAGAALGRLREQGSADAERMVRQATAQVPRVEPRRRGEP
jgi:HEAT repeat protein